ncbi:PIN domain-like protein [Ephemerocybe angulata]|uniref:PIN domain-like protein n=1 Tax=Ephemerocybe angulata TaxID=980116 RepID=A0A8H6IFR0_9AGAR|nr:PIN domain-like protein [Tulosesus angulatus]
MDECVAGTYSAGIHHPFAGGPLRILFFRLAHLLKISANFVFVFDGPNKPEKRGRAVNSQPQLWWVDDAQRLIESFGFYTHEAPGEAEAELALLNRWGMIDALWTSDSDSVVFGGHTILRTIPSKERATGRLDELKLYTTEDVHQKLGLDRGQLLLYSLVAGGDYGNGLRGGGTISASEIARSPIGRSFSSLLDGDINATALDAWRHQTLEILSSNSAADIGLSSRTKNMFLKQIDSFPSIEVLQNYLHPSTSFSHPSYLPDADNWCSIQQPDVARIVGICRQRLGWSRNSSKLRGVLRNNVWEGVIIRLILSVSHEHTQL